jgi:crossover junction endodeoxyribonuclease RusA
MTPGNRYLLPMSDDRLEPDTSLPFPIEFVIRDTPRSHQSANSRGKERWKRRVGEIAGTHVKTLRDFYFIDRRPLAVTIFYFPPAAMNGDVDNIVKLIVDGMVAVIYLDDPILERIIVQKFEPGVEAVFHSLTPTLERAVETDPPVIYIRIDDDLSWRELG